MLTRCCVTSSAHAVWNSCWRLYIAGTLELCAYFPDAKPDVHLDATSRATTKRWLSWGAGNENGLLRHILLPKEHNRRRLVSCKYLFNSVHSNGSSQWQENDDQPGFLPILKTKRNSTSAWPGVVSLQKRTVKECLFIKNPYIIHWKRPFC